MAGKLILWRLLPVGLLLLAAALWIRDVEGGGPYVLRNVVPLALLFLLAFVALRRGGGHWNGRGARLPLATLGFAIPALGLSLYLHYAYAVNLNDMFGAAPQPERLFRFLPAYTTGAGAIGFAIGWIAGRNL